MLRVKSGRRGYVRPRACRALQHAVDGPLRQRATMAGSEDRIVAAGVAHLPYVAVCEPSRPLLPSFGSYSSLAGFASPQIASASASASALLRFRWPVTAEPVFGCSQ